MKSNHDIADDLRTLLAEMELWGRNPSEAFKQVSEQFYKETGWIAPGRSVPLEMGAEQSDERRAAAYATWHLQRRDLRHQTVRDAIEALERMP